MGESSGIDNTNFEKKLFCDQIDMAPSFGDAWAGWKGIFPFWPLFPPLFPLFPQEGEKWGFKIVEKINLKIAVTFAIFELEKRLIRQIKATE